MAAKKKSTRSASASSDTVASNIWAFVGSDDLQVKEAAQVLINKLVAPDNMEFGLEIIEGGADNTEHATRIIRSTREALQTMPFFGDKVVWLKGANFLQDTQTGSSEATLEALNELSEILQAGLPPEIKFIITATDPDKRRSFFLTLKKVAQLTVFESIDTSKADWTEQAARIVTERASEHGLAFDPAALELFVMLAGEQTRQIENELEKLSLYLGEQNEVSVQDVRAIVSQTKGGVVFDLGNAIGARKLPEALALVDQLLYQGENAVGILLAAIVPKVRNMFFARDLAERHGVRLRDYSSRFAYNDYVKLLDRLPEDVVAHLPKKKDGSGINAFPMFLAAKESENYTAAELRAGLESCLEANRRLVTSSLDPKVVLNQLLIRLLTRPQKKPARATA